MKRYLFLIISFSFLGLLSRGQDIDDAYRMSQNQIWGSARFISMGGAFGSLGGDFTTLSYNPAGLGVYQRSEFMVSPGLSNFSTSAEFLGNTTDEFQYNLGFNNLGTVISMQPGKGMVKNLNLAVGYNRLNDFNRYTRIEAFNPSESLVDFFFENQYIGNITGIHPDDLDPFWERLAFDAYVIDTIPGTNYEYGSPVPYGVDMSKRIDSYGRNGELVLSIGANIMHRLYLGATVGIQSYSYNTTITHREEWTDNGFNDFFSFRRELNSSATGYNFKVGFIYRPIDLIRIGGAIHTPTLFRVEDETYNTMQSSFVTGVVVPTDVDGYELSPDLFSYKFLTPFKAIASLGLQFGKMGLFSLDYEYVDYSSMRFREGRSDASFDSQNDLIGNTFKATSNIRAGGEIKLGVLALRAGYAFYGSPYQKGLENEDATMSSISAGIGIRERNYFFDLGYIRSTSGEKHYLYEGESNGAYLDHRLSRFVATIGLRF